MTCWTIQYKQFNKQEKSKVPRWQQTSTYIDTKFGFEGEEKLLKVLSFDAP